MIHNPILPGFNPDPSICRVGPDYYIATSTFEWFPGVALYHSRDLAHWRAIGHALTRHSLLNLSGVTDSSGVWAPSLSYSNGLYHLVYTVVRHRATNFKDVHNYLITAEQINGTWSEPVHLNSSGFDPSLFHDADGRMWLANIEWDHRPGHFRFAGILLQEYRRSENRLVGPVTKILQKSVLSEGPNLYQRDGWYYLTLAEGGTGWNHGVAMARSRTITGPYELDPQPLLLTSRKQPGLTLQKAGHCELVQTPQGQWYMVHLASRPVYPDRHCVLGRETCLQQMEWTEEGWLRLAGGGIDPQVQVASPAGVTPLPWPELPTRDHFDDPTLSVHWQSLRVPVSESWLSLSKRPGWLRLQGRESQHSLFEQSFIARRITHLPCEMETAMQFVPNTYMQSAGLILWYDTRNHFYLRITRGVGNRLVAQVNVTDDGTYADLGHEVSVEGWKTVFMKAEMNQDRTQFFIGRDEQEWEPIGPALATGKLSDDYGSGLKFTGAMCGLCCQDLAGTRIAADFDYFELRS